MLRSSSEDEIVAFVAGLELFRIGNAANDRRLIGQVDDVPNSNLSLAAPHRQFREASFVSGMIWQDSCIPVPADAEEMH